LEVVIVIQELLNNIEILAPCFKTKFESTKRVFEIAYPVMKELYLFSQSEISHDF
jgi:hypothetical protein